MICIILVAGHGQLLEEEIKESSLYTNLVGVPKALLPGVGGKKILDYWWKAIKTRQLFTDVYLVTNADKYKYYERWATASDFPTENIINDGSTTVDNRLGAVADLDLVIRAKSISSDIMVVAGDMLFQDEKFDLSQVLHYFRLHPEGDLALCYEMEQGESTTSRGIIDIDSQTNRILHFYEKPSAEETDSRLASVVFYCLRKETLEWVPEYLSSNTGVEERSFGKCLEWLINKKKMPFYGMKLPTGFQLIGRVSLADYERWLSYFTSQESKDLNKEIIKRAYARVGLMGNPSDGFHGKTIAMSIANFWAEVSIQRSHKLVLVPHPLNDPTEFGSLADVFGISRREGYLGGLRLLQATCKKFYEYCSRKGISLPKRNFTLRYDTNIPRQVGLAGSSAIVTATLQCLMQFFSLTDKDMPKPLQPQFILDVEKEELFIQAGLQDRVVQVYEGLVYMDFSKELLEKNGHGDYRRLTVGNLPKFWLAYLGDPSDSGKAHSDVAARWRSGDKEVHEAMRKFAELTDKAKDAFMKEDWQLLAGLMDENFNLRRATYGDNAVGKANIQMIELARNFQASAKFPGSGGAVVGLCLEDEQLAKMKKSFQSEGYVFCELVMNEGMNSHNPPAQKRSCIL